jgi:hypothetical protein
MEKDTKNNVQVQNNEKHLIIFISDPRNKHWYKSI